MLVLVSIYEKFGDHLKKLSLTIKRRFFWPTLFSILFLCSIPITSLGQTAGLIIALLSDGGANGRSMVVTYENYTTEQYCTVFLPRFKKKTNGIGLIITKFGQFKVQELGTFTYINDVVIDPKTEKVSGIYRPYSVHTLKLKPDIYSIDATYFNREYADYKNKVKIQGFKCVAGQKLYIFAQKIPIKGAGFFDAVKHLDSFNIVDATSKKILWSGYLERKKDTFIVDLSDF